MKLGIFAKTFEGTNPALVFPAVCAAGFSVVQYNMACSGLASLPDEISTEVASAVRASARHFGVEIAAVSATYNMIHPDLSARQHGLRRLEVIASRCADMGTSLITLCTGTRDTHDQWKWHAGNASAESWRDLRVAMEQALAIAERYQVTMGIEPELANVVNSAAKARQLIDEMQSPRLKVIFDAANLFEAVAVDEQKSIVATSIDLLAEHIVMAHAKDRMPDGAFTVAGQGCLDYGHYIACLKSIGFGGALVTHGLTAPDAAGVARFLTSIV